MCSFERFSRPRIRPGRPAVPLDVADCCGRCAARHRLVVQLRVVSGEDAEGVGPVLLGRERNVDIPISDRDREVQGIGPLGLVARKCLALPSTSRHAGSLSKVPFARTRRESDPDRPMEPHTPLALDLVPVSLFAHG